MCSTFFDKPVLLFSKYNLIKELKREQNFQMIFEVKNKYNTLKLDVRVLNEV